METSALMFMFGMVFFIVLVYEANEQEKPLQGEMLTQGIELKCRERNEASIFAAEQID